MINDFIFRNTRGKGQWETGHWKKGHFKMFQGRWDISVIWETGHSILWEKEHFILWETKNPILWERFYPLAIGPRILWESDHLSSGIRDILWETGHGKRDTLSSGNQTTYPQGNILWESGIWEMDFNRSNHAMSTIPS